MNTILKGYFTADGNEKVLDLGVEVQGLEIFNYTEWAASNNGHGYKYEWNSDLGTTALMHYHPAGDHTAAVNATTAAVYQFDSSNYALGASVAVTDATNAVGPVFSTGSTANLYDHTIVRIVGGDQLNLNGLDFSIDTIVANTTFDLANNLATAPGITAGACFYKIVAPNRAVYDKIFPANRIIADISVAASAVVTTLVDHGYAVNQLVRIYVPSNQGMVEMNELTGKITAITASTFTVDIDSSAFTAFTFPTYAIVNMRRAYVVPVGDTTTLGFDGSTRNTAFRGIVLRAGTTKPAGSNGDVIYWKAWKAADLV